jgi:DNA-binding transcriptional LysR family regulator
LDPVGHPCSIRDQALTALRERGLSWHITFSSYSLTALQAAVRAGLGIGLLAESAVTPDMHVVSTDLLPSLKPADIVLYRAADATTDAVDTLSDFLVAHLQTVPFLEPQKLQVEAP